MALDDCYEAMVVRGHLLFFFHVENMAEVVLLNLFMIGIPTSLLIIFKGVDNHTLPQPIFKLFSFTV